jgi:hypothetical protein
VSESELTYPPQESGLSSMNLTRHMGRFFGAVIVMISLFGASSAAFAHSGHEHATSVEKVAVQTVLSTDDQVRTEADDIGIRDMLVETAPSDIPAKRRCMGGCCSSASGHACCGIALPLDSASPRPYGTSAAQAFADPSLRNGLEPEALRKPPRAFA